MLAYFDHIDNSNGPPKRSMGVGTLAGYRAGTPQLDALHP